MNTSALSVFNRGLAVVGVGILMVLLLTACSSPAPETEEEVEQVTLKIGNIVPLQEDVIGAYAVDKLPDVLEEEAPGMFDIEFAGGPETFPPLELYGYVEDRTIDIASLPTTFYGGEIFLAVAANYPNLSPEELRAIGFNDWMDDLHAEHGIKYLGRSASGIPFHCYTQKPVESPEDLEGIPMYGTTTTQSLLENFGAEVVFMPLPELYTAIERGVVEGMCQPEISLVVSNEYYEHLDYMIEPGFYQLEMSLIMNRESWDDLSATHQEALTRGIRELERRVHEFTRQKSAEHREFLLDQDIEVARFEGEDAERWTRSARREFWYYLFDESGDHERIRELNSLLEEADYETYFPEELEG